LYPIIRIEKPGVFSRDAIFYNVILLIVYFVFLGIKRKLEKNTFQREKFRRVDISITRDLFKTKKIVITACVAGIVIFELASNTYSNFSLYKEVPERDLYIVELYDDIQNVKEEIVLDKSFYRMEQLPDRVFSDGKMFNYNGISIFSITYDNVVGLLDNFGISSSVNKMEYRLNTPLLNSIFSVKYSLGREPRRDYLPEYFQNITTSEKVALGRNPYALPIGFMVNSDILDWQGEKEKNAFVFQNKFVEKSTGILEPLFSEPIQELEIEGTLLSYEMNDDGSYQYTVDNNISPIDNPTITYTYYINETGRYYLNVCASKLRDVTVFWEDDVLNRISNGIAAGNEEDTVDIGELKAGTQLTATLHIKNDLLENDSIGVKSVWLDNGSSLFGRMISLIVDSSLQSLASRQQTGVARATLTKINEDTFMRVYDTLSSESLQMTSFSDTEINGTVSVADEKVFFTSIPYDTRWKVYVNGYEMPTVRVMNALLGIKLDKGDYIIDIHYKPTGIILSYAITLLSFVVLFIIEKFILSGQTKTRVK